MENSRWYFAHFNISDIDFALFNCSCLFSFLFSLAVHSFFHFHLLWTFSKAEFKIFLFLIFYSN